MRVRRWFVYEKGVNVRTGRVELLEMRMHSVQVAEFNGRKITFDIFRFCEIDKLSIDYGDLHRNKEMFLSNLGLFRNWLLRIKHSSRTNIADASSNEVSRSFN